MSEKRVTIDPANVTVADVYHLMIGAIVPRPIAFVSTMSRHGIGNLAPFSYFNAVASAPASLVFSVTRKPGSGEKKDTLRNIEETREFVVNVATEPLVHAVNQSSALYPYGVDEMKKVGLTPLASQRVKPARVAESPIHFECELLQTVDVGEGKPGSSTLVIGRIVLMHFSDRVYRAGTINPRELAPLARLGGLSYVKLGEVFDLPKPTAD